jgi:uncharacterized protein (TIGR02266 family)
VQLVYCVLDEEGNASEPISAHTSNIGVGGAFILCEDPEPPGTELAIKLRMPESGKIFDLKGEVRWIADGEDDALHGMGVKFFDLDVTDMLELNDYFASLGLTDLDDGD